MNQPATVTSAASCRASRGNAPTKPTRCAGRPASPQRKRGRDASQECKRFCEASGTALFFCLHRTSPTHIPPFYPPEISFKDHAMRRSLSLLLCLIAVCAIHAADPQPPKGFTPLFNGKDLTGWHGMPHFDPYKLDAMRGGEAAVLG